MTTRYLAGVDIGGTHTESHFSTLARRMSGLRLYTLTYYV